MAEEDFDVGAAVEEVASTLDTVPDTPDIPPTPPAPASWSKEMHEHWGRLDPKVRDYVTLREKQMAEGVVPLKEQAAYAKQVREVLAPYENDLRAQGIDSIRAVQTLLNSHRLLSNPDTQARSVAARQLLQYYGITPDVLGSSTEAPYVDPAVTEVLNRVTRLEQGLQQSAHQQREAALRQINLELDDFAKSHPHYNEVEEDIALLLQNPSISLEEAYERALWSNPATRVRAQQEAQAKQAAALKAQAEAARRAAAPNIRGTPGSSKTEEAPAGSLEDTIRNQLATIRARPS